MTPPTDELSRLLTSAADDVIVRAQAPGPDTSALWGRGRRVTWAARGAAAGLVAVAVLLVTAVALVMRPATATVPADGSQVTYPELVSELFPGGYDGGPVFGVVTVAQDPTAWPYAIDRSGLLSLVPGVSPLSEGGVLAPDGLHLLLADGVVDLSDGILVRPNVSDEVIQARRGDWAVWAPDSRHVLVDTVDGPAVLDGFLNVAAAPGPDDRTIRPAGWRDAGTVLGVRDRSTGGRAALEVVTRGLTDDTWTSGPTIDVGGAGDRLIPGVAHASPDGSRLLLLSQPSAGSDAARALLVDARTGQRVAFTGAGPEDVPVFDACTPVWQGDQPLTASAGLRRPGDGATVMGFSGRMDLGCVTLPGNELTGSPDPRSAGAVRENVWRVALPVGGVLAAMGAVWMVLALRRSRRHGERFLPMIWVQRF